MRATNIQFTELAATDDAPNILVSHDVMVVSGAPEEALDTVLAQCGLHVRDRVELTTPRDRAGRVFGPLEWPVGEEICPTQDSLGPDGPPRLKAVRLLDDPDWAYTLAPTERICDLLPGALLDRLRDGGWELERNFHKGFGIGWKEAFGVPDLDALEALLSSQAARLEQGSGRLSTIRHLSAFVTDAAGDASWCNQFLFLNSFSLGPRRSLLARAFAGRFPIETRFGDGSPVTESEVAIMQAAYDDATTTLQLNAGDLLVVDNHRIALGRTPSHAEIRTETVTADAAVGLMKEISVD